jgi:hypothetical protein
VAFKPCKHHAEKVTVAANDNRAFDEALDLQMRIQPGFQPQA